MISNIKFRKILNKKNIIIKSKPLDQIKNYKFSKLASKRDKKTEWFRISLNELKDLIKDTIYKNDKNVFIEKEIFEDELPSAVPSTNDNDDSEFNTSTSPKKKEKKGSFLKILYFFYKYI